MLAILMKGEVEIAESRERFRVGGVEYPEGTFHISTDQPAGAWAKTLMDVQHYPSQYLYPGGPLKAPYDITSHCLPLQMGVNSISIEARLSVPTATITSKPKPPAGLNARQSSEHFVVAPTSNASVMLANRVLANHGRMDRTLADFYDGRGDFPLVLSS